MRETLLPNAGIARCPRCGAELYRSRSDSLDRALAYALASMVLFVLGNAFPIVGLALKGDVVQTTLFGAVRVLYRDGIWPMAALVFVTTILMPFLQIAGITYLLLPLKFRRLPRRPELVFRVLQWAQPWGMTEVWILGLLVAVVKLAHIAGVVPGIALWSFGVLMLLLAAAGTAFDPRDLWAKVGMRR
jgi:paraquat-inducible protein A